VSGGNYQEWSLTMSNGQETPAKQPDPDVADARGAVHKYFARLTELSWAAPPDASNHANGFWVAYVRDDAQLRDHASQFPEHYTGDARQLARTLGLFHIRLMEAFAHGNVPGPWSGKFLDWEDGIKSIARLTALIVLGASTEAAIAAELRSAINQVRAKAASGGGEHPNGHISVDVVGAAQKTRETIDAAFNLDAPTQGALTARKLREVMVALEALPTQGHDPWLTPEWQLAFDKVTASAFRAFAPSAYWGH
jgi:hypothetical protein